MFGKDVKTKSRTRGEGQFGMIVGLAVAIVAGVAGFKILPLHIQGNELKDAMEEQANFGGMKPPEKIKWAIYEIAQKSGVPLKLDDIKISFHGANINIQAKYERAVDVLGYHYVYKFDKEVDKPIF